MPFALTIIGLLMIVSGSRDTYAAFGKELVEDFTGPGNFTYWIVALGAIGALGYVPQLRTFSRAFMALIIVAMVLRNGGVFSKFTEALQSGPVRPGDSAKTIGAANDGMDNPVTKALSNFDPAAYSSNAAGENFQKAVNAAKLFFL